jgi:glycine cleavage system T protein (aminomethyltransferase)
MCYEHGGMIDDGTLFRLGDNNFRWIGGDPYAASGCASRLKSLD